MPRARSLPTFLWARIGRRQLRGREGHHSCPGRVRSPTSCGPVSFRRSSMAQRRPRAERTAARRYREPSLLDSMRGDREPGGRKLAAGCIGVVLRLLLISITCLLAALTFLCCGFRRSSLPRFGDCSLCRSFLYRRLLRCSLLRNHPSSCCTFLSRLFR